MDFTAKSFVRFWCNNKRCCYNEGPLYIVFYVPYCLLGLGMHASVSTRYMCMYFVHFTLNYKRLCSMLTTSSARVFDIYVYVRFKSDPPVYKCFFALKQYKLFASSEHTHYVGRSETHFLLNVYDTVMIHVTV